MNQLLEGSKQYKTSQNAMFAKLSDITKMLSKGVIKWGRTNSLWPMQFGLACCAMELLDFGSSRHRRGKEGIPAFQGDAQADRRDDSRWLGHEIHGPSRQKAVRADGKAKVCNRLRRVCHFGRPMVRELQHTERDRPDTACRCLCCGMPSKAGEPFRCDDEATGKDKW